MTGFWMFLSGISDALVGAHAALAGSFLSLWYSRRTLEQQSAESAKERKGDLLREKGEELYGALAHFNINFAVSQLPLFRVMKGEITYDDYLDIHNSQDYSSKYDVHRMQMLVEVYFPALIE